MRSFLSVLLFQRTLPAIIVLCLLFAAPKQADAEPLKLTPAEKSWINTHPVIKVRIGKNYPPFELFKDGSYQGISYDILMKLAQKTGLSFEPVEGLTWKDALKSVENRQGLDMLLLVTRTPEREQFLAFTENYISFPLVIFVRKDAHFISSLKDLTGMTVVVEKGFAKKQWMMRDEPGLKFLEVEGSEEAIAAVASGEAEAYVGNLAVGTYYIDHKHLTNLKVAAPSPYSTDAMAMGVRSDWPELQSILNKALNSLTVDEDREIRGKWLSMRVEHGIRTLDIIKWVAGVAIVLLGFIFQLRRMVNSRTAELQQSLHKLEDTHRQLADIIEFLPDATFVLDREGRVLAWNRAIEEMTGILKEDMVGKGDHAYSIPFYGVARPVLADQILGDHKPDAFQYEDFRRQGAVLAANGFTPALNGGCGAYIYAMASPLTDHSGNLVGAIESLRNITSVREAESEIRALNDELELRVEKRTVELEQAKEELSWMNEDLGRRGQELEEANRRLESFAYSVSHDLRAPLRHIKSFTDLIVEGHEERLDEEGQLYFKRITAACKRMDEMITAMLELAQSSNQKIHQELVDMSRLVDEVLSELPVEQSSITLQDLPPCNADRTLMKQVYANLIGNAVKYSRMAEDAKVEIGSETKDGKTVYFVRDNGIGFDMVYADKLFGVFQRLHASTDFEGVGIGLAIVHSIIQKHGGSIWAEGAQGKGATFYFTLE
jgi:PAS domain S-box-containing protein